MNGTEDRKQLSSTMWKRMLAAVGTKDNLNPLIYFAASVFGAALGFFTLPVFVRLMPKAEIGLYGYALAVNTFLLPLLLLSVENFYLKSVYSTTDKHEQNRLLSSVVLFVFLWSLVFIGVLLLAGPALFGAAGINVPFYPTIAIAIVSNVLSVFTTFALLNYRIRGKAWHYFTLTVIQNLAITGVSLFIVVRLNHGAFGRISGMTIGTLGVGILSCSILFRKLVFRIDWKLVRQAVWFSLPLIPYTFATLLFDILDRFFLERYSDLSELAVYSISFQYAAIALMVSLALFKSYEPDLFRLTTGRHFTEVVRKIIRFGLINFVCSALLILLADFTVNLLTHGQYHASIRIAQWLIVALFLKAAFLNLSTVLTALGKNVFLMFISLIGLVAVIAASVWFVETYEGTGTALIKCGLYAFIFLGTFLFFARRQAFYRFLLATALQTAGLIGLIYFSDWLF